MCILLFVDDERSPEDIFWMELPKHSSYIVCKTPDEFVDNVILALGSTAEFVVSFDHDLQYFIGEREETGYDCLKFLVSFCQENNMKLPECTFHTQNPVGKENMLCYYQNALKHTGEF